MSATNRYVLGLIPAWRQWHNLAMLYLFYTNSDTSEVLLDACIHSPDVPSLVSQERKEFDNLEAGGIHSRW